VSDSANRKILAANWKMHGSREMVVAYVDRLRPVSGVELVLFPPVGYLGIAAELIGKRAPYVALGAQDVHEQESGAFTGETSAGMIADLGGRFAIVGHSERRRYANEGDQRVALKARAAFRAGLQPVVCVGETLEERSAGLAQTVVARQLDAVVSVLTAEEYDALIVAYEPVWAIGTGRSASTGQVEEMHVFIRSAREKVLGQGSRSTLLYGGSVTENSAPALFGLSAVDGALVGGAALDAHRFVRIGELLRSAQT
jgi:triosephosphate isomerase